MVQNHTRYSRTVPYFGSDNDDDDDEDGSGYDPYFKPLDTDDPIFL